MQIHFAKPLLLSRPRRRTVVRAASAGANRIKPLLAPAILGLALLLKPRLDAQSVSASTAATPPTAALEQVVTLRGSVRNWADFWPPLVVTEAFFVVHHASGSRATSNLLAHPVVIYGWERVDVTNHFTIQAGDPQHLVIDFIASGFVETPGSPPFGCQVGCQVLVTNGGVPALRVAPHGPGALAVSWPSLYRDWMLESTTDLNFPWNTVASAVSVTNDQCVVVVNSRANERRFFRLVR